MPEIPQPEIYKVVIPEHEDCFGNKIYGSIYFDNERDALCYVTSYNSAYWVPYPAEYIGRV